MSLAVSSLGNVATLATPDLLARSIALPGGRKASFAQRLQHRKSRSWFCTATNTECTFAGEITPEQRQERDPIQSDRIALHY